MEFFLGTSGATLFGERDTLCLCPFVGKKLGLCQAGVRT